MEQLSVAEAALVLGVDDSRVRQMLRSGALAGRHVGRAWVVPEASLAVVREQPPAPGRPLAPKRAWALLDLLDGGGAPWLAAVARSQVRAQLRRLAGQDAAAWRAALRGREQRLPVSGHRGALQRLASAEGVWLAGPAAAPAAGSDLVVVDAAADFYVAPQAWRALSSRLRLSIDAAEPLALVRLPLGLWPFGEAGPQRAALAASLLDGTEWRAATAGAEVLNDLAADFVR